ncbi:MAG: hypothetical protein ACLFQV_11020 [Vulcanimicrobiota bacterium]
MINKLVADGKADFEQNEKGLALTIPIFSEKKINICNFRIIIIKFLIWFVLAFPLFSRKYLIHRAERIDMGEIPRNNMKVTKSAIIIKTVFLFIYNTSAKWLRMLYNLQKVLFP